MGTNQKHIKIILLLLVLSIAVFFRFYKLNEIPPGLYPDVAVNGTDAINALQSGDFKLYYPENNGREGLFINLIALSFWLFGQSAWAIKIVPAFFGVLTVIGTYLLTKQLFTAISSFPQLRGGFRWGGVFSSISTSPNPSSSEEGRQKENLCPFGLTASDAIALLSTFFLAVSFWHVNFSRLGFRAIMVPFFLVWSLYFLFRGLDADLRRGSDADKNSPSIPLSVKGESSPPYGKRGWGRIFYLLIAGLLFGLGFHTYISFRVAPLILAPIFIFDCMRIAQIHANYAHTNKRREYRNLISRWLIFALGIIIAASPMIYYYVQNPQDFMGRATQVSIFNSQNPTLTIAWSTIKTLGQFIVYGDPNSRHNISGSPQIFWPLIPFFIIGLAHVTRQIVKRKNYSDRDYSLLANCYLLFIWWSSMLLPSIFTNEGLPHALRSIGAIPPSYIFTGLGFYLTIFWLSLRVPQWRDETIPHDNNGRLSSTGSPHSPAARLAAGSFAMTLCVFLFLFGFAVIEYHRYFIYWGQSKQTQSAFSKDLYDGANYLKNLPAGVKKYVIINEESPNNCHQGISISSHTIKFTAPPDTEFTWLGCPRFQEWLHPAKREPTIFLPLRHDENLFKALRQFFPQGGIESHDNFSVYRVGF